jgi:hypothetical protein
MALLVTPADRASFRRCRRQWDFGARSRRNLEPTARPPGPDLAGALREALDIYYFPGMWDWERSVTLPLVVQAFERAMDRQQAAAGGQSWPEHREAGLRTLRRYFDWAPGADSFSPVLVEAEYEANVPDPDNPEAGLVAAPGDAVRYRGRVDLLAVDAHDAYWIVRHRLVSGPWPPVADLLADPEPLAACWAWEQFYLGMAIEGVIYNEIRQPGQPGQAGQPAPPGPSRPPWTARLRRLVGGAERRAERGPAPRQVRQHEPSGGGRSIPQHRRMYATARQPARAPAVEQRTSPDFRRTWLRRSRDEVAAEGRRLARDAAEMIAAPGIQPSPSVRNCPPCPFLDPCLAIFAGDDPGPILAASYRERPADLPLEGRLGGGAWGMGRGAAPPRFGRR